MSERVKILITGATGFVGRAIIEALVKSDKYEIYGLKGKSFTTDFGESKNIKQIIGCNISEYDTLKDVEKIGQIDFVVHCAGLAHQFGEVPDEDFYRVNVQGTENICQLAAKLGAKQLIHLSSVAVYGDYGQREVDEKFECRPVGIYAESKLAAEKAAKEICENKNIDLTILRLATVIGENDRVNTARLITSIDGGNFVWIGNGRNFKSLIYKKDVARAILRVLNDSKSNLTEIYNVCGGKVSMKTVVETIFDCLCKKKSRLKIPESLFLNVFGLNKQTFNIRILSKYEKVVEKWLSDDIFSGAEFNENFDFQIETTVTEAIGLQVGNYLKLKSK